MQHHDVIGAVADVVVALEDKVVAAFTAYAEGLSRALIVLKRKGQEPSYRELLEREEAVDGQKLQALLAVPLQGLVELSKCFASLVECTPASHVDHQDSLVAAKIMRDLLAAVSKTTATNRGVSQLEQFAKLVSFPHDIRKVRV